MNNRRDFVKLAGLFSLGAATGTQLMPKDVKEIDDWNEVPAFQNGDVLKAETLMALRDSILQLQKEVERLRNVSI